jgi:hypothetical protein
MKIKESYKSIAVILTGAVVFLGSVRGCNMALNHRNTDNPAYHLVSRSTGLTGHIEFIRYADGS